MTVCIKYVRVGFPLCLIAFKSPRADSFTQKHLRKSTITILIHFNKQSTMVSMHASQARSESAPPAESSLPSVLWTNDFVCT